jgi:hypothetical protein
MRKLAVVIVLLGLFAALIPASHAQETSGALPACSEDELAATIEGLTAYDEGLATLSADYDLSVDPTDAAYGATLVALDAISYEYWNTFYPVLPQCAEAQAVAFVVGSIYDEYLTIGLLNNIAGWTDAAGAGEDAQAFADQSAARVESLNFGLEAISDMSVSDLVSALSGETLESCTEEQVTALADVMSSVFGEMSDQLDTLGDDPVVSFAFTEGVAWGFEDEVYSEVSTCAENAYLADLFRLTLNETNIVAGLYANAAEEAAAGNTDVADELSASADQRAADLQAAWEMFGTTVAAG